MSLSSENAIYYSIDTNKRFVYFAGKSIKSLRNYNKKIKVFLFIYGDLKGVDLTLFEENNIEIINKPPVKKDFLTSLKWLSLPAN